ncbi:MAG TPA: DUF2306 domain-containing protein [Allosphingosinicella sp.]
MNPVLHAAIMWTHIGAGLLALVAGAIAAAMRKGGATHARAGKGFVVAMLVLGITAAVLEPFRPEPGSPLGGILVCYFVLTGWVAARRRDGRPARIEIAACIFVLGASAAIFWAGLSGTSTTPAGVGPLFVFAAVCLLAGLGDLRAILSEKLAPAQRLSRHLWRMCAAFFIATGSFFLGQQDVLPAAVRGSPVLFVLGFAPLGLMVYWLVRLRVGRKLTRLTLRRPAEQAGA